MERRPRVACSRRMFVPAVLFALAVLLATRPASETLSATGPLTFNPVQNLAIEPGLAPFKVAMGDLNRDGKADLVVMNRNGTGGYHGSVNAWLGDGKGNFTFKRGYPARTPTCVALGDVNKDGILDLAFGNSEYSVDLDLVTVQLGTGDGTFGPQFSYHAGGRPVSVGIGDLNADGAPDLVVANGGNSNKVTVLRGDGDGSFGSPVSYAAGASPLSVALGDVNTDGRTDLVVANPDSNTVSLLFGNGDGTLQGAVAVSVGAGPDSVAIADLNGDGRPDLSVANGYSNTVSVLLGKGDGTFQDKVDHVVGENCPWSVAITDVNGDGKPDLAVANGGDGSSMGNVSLLAGIGDGTFQAPVNLVTGDSPASLAAGDVNGDGKADLAVANPPGDSVSVLINATEFEPSGHFAPAATSPMTAGPQPYSLAIGDVNRDGKADLAVTNTLMHGSPVNLLLGAGDGAFEPGASYTAGGRATSVATADLNTDGKADLVVTDLYNVTVLLADGQGTFAQATGSPFPAGTKPTSVAVGDLNRDGKSDLAVANVGGGNISVLLGNGDGTFQAKADFAAGTNPHSVAIGDVNRDGKPDLAVANSASDNVSVLLGNGDGTFQTKADLAMGGPAGSVSIGDLNRDGKPDLAVASSTTNSVTVLLGNGDGTFQPKTDVAAGTYTVFAAIGDMNQDGNPDLVAVNLTSKDVSVICGKGDGTFQPAVNFPAGEGPHFVAIGDLNADGKLDLAVTNLGTPENEYKLTILINTWDAIAPLTTAATSPLPNAAGWNNTAVTFTASADDGAGGTGVAETRCVLDPAGVPASFDDLPAGNCAGVTASSDGAHTFYAASRDYVGNKETAVVSKTARIDTTAPTLAPVVSPNPVLLGGSATVAPNAADALSGLASQSCGALDTTSVGSRSVACTATDNAGNTTSASATYAVVYAFTGFFSPVDNSQVWNVAKAGQTVPFKWYVADAGGTPVTNLVSVTVTAITYSCALGTTDDLLEEYAAGASGLQNLGNGYYQFNWTTPRAYANSCKTVRFDLGEGTGKEHSALFKFPR